MVTNDTISFSFFFSSSFSFLLLLIRRRRVDSWNEWIQILFRLFTQSRMQGDAFASDWIKFSYPNITNNYCRLHESNGTTISDIKINKYMFPSDSNRSVNVVKLSEEMHRISCRQICYNLFWKTSPVYLACHFSFDVLATTLIKYPLVNDGGAQ